MQDTLPTHLAPTESLTIDLSVFDLANVRAAAREQNMSVEDFIVGAIKRVTEDLTGDWSAQ